MKQSLYMQIYQYLKTAISNGQYRPGDMIPTEEELMKQFRVSRSTTNRALQALTLEGLLNRRAGLGTFVNPHRDESPQSTAPSLLTASANEYASVTPDVSAEGTAYDRYGITAITRPAAGSLVGFVTPFLTQPFGPLVLVHLEQLLNQRGISVVVATSSGDQEREQECIDRLVYAGAKGMVVLPVNGEFYNQAILRLHVQRFPVILVDKSLPGVPIANVTSDNMSAAQALTDHLIGQGHHTIGFCAPDVRSPVTSLDVHQGFLEALAKHDIRPVDDCIVPASYSPPAPHGIRRRQVDTIRQFIDAYPEVTAFVATDDRMANLVLAASKQIGRRVPQDLAIACLDAPAAKTMYSSFTHAIPDEEQMAKECVRLLDELWSGDGRTSPQNVVVPCRLHYGESSEGRMHREPCRTYATSTPKVKRSGLWPCAQHN